MTASVSSTFRESWTASMWSAFTTAPRRSVPIFVSAGQLRPRKISNVSPTQVCPMTGRSPSVATAVVSDPRLASRWRQLTTIAMGHTARGCKEERVVNFERVEVKCVNCDGVGHRARDCTEPRHDKFACRNCGYLLPTMILKCEC